LSGAGIAEEDEDDDDPGGVVDSDLLTADDGGADWIFCSQPAETSAAAVKAAINIV